MTDVHPATSRAPEPGRILLVDDDVSVRRFVNLILSEAGYDVESACSAEEALELLPGSNFEVGLIDLDLPGRSGLELLPELPDGIVSVMLTGTKDVGAAVTGMKRGAFDYLPKPSDAAAIRWSVARALGVARSRRRERALERVAADWAATFDACPDILLVLDAEGRILRANRAAELCAGPSIPQLPGRYVQDVLPDELGLAAMRCSRPGDVPCVLPVIQTAAGLHYLLSCSAIAASGAPSSVVVAQEVTPLVAAEREQTRLARALMTAQEDERGRIARELHDGIGQSLVSISIGLSTVAEEVAVQVVRERLRAIGRVSADALDEVRQMAHALRPAILEELGLLAALARLTSTFTTLHGFRAELVLAVPPECRFPHAVELSVYRIVQEALANVAKHASARTVDVLIESDETFVHASVSDDGIGFSRADSGRNGMGLSDMRERAVMLGGEFRADTEPGRGTTIGVRIPHGGMSS